MGNANSLLLLVFIKGYQLLCPYRSILCLYTYTAHLVNHEVADLVPLTIPTDVSFYTVWNLAVTTISQSGCTSRATCLSPASDFFCELSGDLEAISEDCNGPINRFCMLIRYISILPTTARPNPLVPFAYESILWSFPGLLPNALIGLVSSCDDKVNLLWDSNSSYTPFNKQGINLVFVPPLYLKFQSPKSHGNKNVI